MSEPGTNLATTGSIDAVHVPLNGPLDNVDQAWRLAKIFAQAGIIQTDLKNSAANTFLVILYGQRLGIPPEIAISTIGVVKGKPRMSGQLLLAKVREAGHKPKIVHGNGKCTVTIVRGDDGEEHTEEFSLDDAVTAELCKIKDGKPWARSNLKGDPLPWELYPKRMLMWRALGFCVDVICPEVKMGFVVEGELDQEAIAEPRTLNQVAAERMDQPQPVDIAGSTDPDRTEQDQRAALEAELARLSSEHTALQDHEAAALAELAAEESAKPSPDYVCDVCNIQGDHFQDVCPDVQHPAEEVGP